MNSVARVMRAAGIAAKTKRQFRQTTDSNHDLPMADNASDRQPVPAEPNARRCADITYVPTREGWPYPAVEALFGRRAIGRSMSETTTSRLVADALETARAHHRPLTGSSPSGLVAHSDRGSQYASEHDQRRPKDEWIGCSTRAVDQCWDNAPMERFCASQEEVGPFELFGAHGSGRTRMCRSRRSSVPAT